MQHMPQKKDSMRRKKASLRGLSTTRRTRAMCLRRKPHPRPDEQRNGANS
ncbi:hypothetical protein FOQG_19075 [Fusarium oxysporum f. sp. raphani 54005]|uniref:Uncharacterized protein n=1 Tax=Fusarium oxysporum f. sp. raphani 54005 TaxID=1089458 RepID=X0B254_FUSOX|nr:hypothetical protein FOQG_19075 [Fusarium oxysporum f. sp. raphani 54005]